MSSTPYDKELEKGFSTLQLHAGYTPDENTKAVAVPIYQTSSQEFNSCEHAANLFGLKAFGNIQSRIMNPTCDVLEKRLAALEGGTAAVATSSGQACVLATILMLAQSGDNIVSQTNLQGGTLNMFKVSLSRMGIETRFIGDSKWGWTENNKNLNDISLIENMCDDNTKVFFCESIGNPTYECPDFDSIKKLCVKQGLPLIVDNTFGMGGYICRPGKFGADIVVHSCTKWIGGHGTSVGGCMVDIGTMKWDVKDSKGKNKFPLMVDPSPAYHGMEFQKTFGPNGVVGKNIAFAIRFRTEGLRDLGVCMSPMNAFLSIQGLETLSLRANAICENSKIMAKWLMENAAVSWVCFPGLTHHESHQEFSKYFRPGCFGGIMSFGVKGGYDAAKSLIEHVKICTHLANVGDAKSLVIHPASTTHSQLTEEELKRSNIPQDMVRFSVGQEDVRDIQEDLNQAFLLYALKSKI